MLEFFILYLKTLQHNGNRFNQVSIFSATAVILLSDFINKTKVDVLLFLYHLLLINVNITHKCHRTLSL